MADKEIIKWAKDLAWRPTKMTPETVKKLLDAFSYSFTDLEACIYADISKQTLYDYCKKFPEFTDHKEALKSTPNIKAKMNWVKEIKEWKYQSSKEWLERKSRDEFSLKEIKELAWEVTVKNIENVEIL